MTDRINALTVVLDQDYRDDDVEAIVKAIQMIRGVLQVIPNVASFSDHIAITRAQTELRQKLWKVLND